MKNTEKYIAPDMDFISFDILTEITLIDISASEDPSRDAVIDWS